MALPLYPNAISLSAVNVELSYTSTQSITLNDAAVRSLFVKASGAIAMSDGHGKSAYVPDINSATWPGVDATYDYNGYRTMLKYHAAGQGSTTYFTLQNSASIGYLLMNGRAGADSGDGAGGSDERNNEDCCVCDGSDNRDKGGRGGDGGSGGALLVIENESGWGGGVAYSIVIGVPSSASPGGTTTAFGRSLTNDYTGTGNLQYAGPGGEGQHAVFDENCDGGQTGPGAGGQGDGYVESWTGQGLRFGQPGQGGGGGVGDCGCGQSSGVGAQGYSGSGYGAGGGGGGGSTPYLAPTGGSPNPDNSTAGGAVLIRFRYRPV